MQVVPQSISSISQKGQITIPVEIRRRLKVKPKDKVAFNMDGNEVKIIPLGSILDTSFQVVSPLKKRLSEKMITQIASEEHAKKIAQEGI